MQWVMSGACACLCAGGNGALINAVVDLDENRGGWRRTKRKETKLVLNNKMAVRRRKRPVPLQGLPHLLLPQLFVSIFAPCCIVSKGDEGFFFFCCSVYGFTSLLLFLFVFLRLFMDTFPFEWHGSFMTLRFTLRYRTTATVTSSSSSTSTQKIKPTSSITRQLIHSFSDPFEFLFLLAQDSRGSNQKREIGRYIIHYTQSVKTLHTTYEVVLLTPPPSGLVLGVKLPREKLLASPAIAWGRGAPPSLFYP